MPTMLSRRTFMCGLMTTVCSLLCPCAGLASIAQGVVSPVSTKQLEAEFNGLCQGAEQLLTGKRPAKEIQKILQNARAIHAGLLPLPSIGGPKNLVYSSYLVGPQYVALYKAMQPHGFGAEDVGKLVYDLAEYSFQANAAEYKANGERFFTPQYYATMQAWAKRSQQRHYPMDWVVNVFRGNGKDYDIGVDYSECGLLKYFAAQGVPELSPYPCRVDFPTARAEGTGLVRTTTLAEGGKVCNFRYKKGRPVMQGWKDENARGNLLQEVSPRAPFPETFIIEEWTNIAAGKFYS